MSSIYVSTTGNGSAGVDNYNPNNGDVVTIFAYPDDGAQLLDLTMQSEYGYYIAIYVQQIQQIVYDSSWGDCTIYATFSHDIITVNSNGNGYAYVDDLNPSDGQTVTLYSTPGSRKYEVVGITCTDQNGNTVWSASAETVSFNYDANWGDITINVYFDLKWIFKNLWFLCKVSQDWRFR